MCGCEHHWDINAPCSCSCPDHAGVRDEMARRSETIRVKVTVDTDELREWAGRHADAGRHGVAHVLYKAAEDGESLSEQAVNEARTEGVEAVTTLLRKVVDYWDGPPTANHGDHIYADLRDVLRAFTPAEDAS